MGTHPVGGVSRLGDRGASSAAGKLEPLKVSGSEATKRAHLRVHRPSPGHDVGAVRDVAQA
jgi:hypothetical protein